MLDSAHQQLGGPIVLVWDSDTSHKDAAMKKLIAARARLTVFYLPAYAPILNPVEGIPRGLAPDQPRLTATGRRHPHADDPQAKIFRALLVEV
jgi:DDE superfamily endonuclease